MARRSLILIMLLTMPCISLIAGDPYKVEQVPIIRETGLEIRDIVQDHMGFIWIGTGNGLYRFDGRFFRHFQKERHNPESLLSNKITQLLVDSKGRLWVGSNKGLSLRTENGFQHWTDEGGTEGLKQAFVTDIVEDKRGWIWVTTYGGISRLDPDAYVVINYHEHEKYGDYKDGPFAFAIVDGKGNPYFTARDGLLRYEEGEDRFRLTPITRTERHRWTAVATMQMGFLVLALGEDLYIYDPYRNSAVPFPTEKKMQVGAILVEGENVWFGTEENSLIRMSRKKSIVYPANPQDFNSLSYHQVRCLFQAKDGTVWIGTASGLNKMHSKGPHFQHVTSSRNSRDHGGLISPHVYSILRDKAGAMWFSTESGLSMRRPEERGFVSLSRGELPFQLKDTAITGLALDEEGYIWAAGSHYLHKISPEEAHVIQAWKHNIPGEFFAMTSYKGRIWMLGEKGEGLLSLNPRTGEQQWFRHDPTNPDSIGANTGYALAVDRLDRLWVINEKGLERFDDENERFLHYYPEERPFDEAGMITFLYQDARHRIWLGGTYGLVSLDERSGTFRHYTRREGLFVGTVFAITSDDSGFLWLSHDKGITRYNPDNREAYQYDNNDGLNNKFNWNSVYRDPDGTIYFGGSNGFNAFNPEDFGRNPYVPPIVVTDIIVNRDDFEPYSKPWEVHDLTVPEGVGIKFYFSAMDYTNPRKNMYSYKIDGLGDWSVPSTENWASIYGLKPGEYTLRLRGANNDGVWNETDTSMQLVVLKPWWMSNLAILFYIISVPALLYGLHQLRVAKLKANERHLAEVVEERTSELRREKDKTEEQARKLLELDELKTQFFANVSHEFRTPLTLIIGPLEGMLSGELDDNEPRRKQRYEVMLRNGRRLLRLINQLLDITKLEAGKMKLLTRPTELVGFTRPIVYAFHSLAEKRDMKLDVQVEQDEIPVYIDREKIEKVLFNLLSNAFGFTGFGGTVKVRMLAERDKQGRKVARIEVIDNGEGIPAADLPHLFDRFRQADGSMTRKREGTGIGLSLVKELVTLHGGEVWLESEQGKGTTAIFTIPLGKSHLAIEQILDMDIDEQEVLPTERVQVELANLEEVDYEKVKMPAVGETLLIVDDLSDVRNYIRDAFPDYRVVEAVDGEHGLQTARKIKPDLIISDVMMPVMDGYSLCRALKRDRELAHVPVILLTAKASDEMKVEGLEIGADDYMSKPFNLRELRVRVRNLLHMRAQERGLRKSLEMAHRAQTSMLPSEVPKLPGLDIAAFCQPASEVGGDYYDFLSRGDGKLGVVIGDVSGKGMPAALYMTMTKGLVQAYSGKAQSPRDMLTRINRQFSRASTANTFISLLYAVIDPERGEMIYANAGHNPMILCREGKAVLLKSHGMAVGLEGGTVFDKVVADEAFYFKPGDTLVLYTDGITEAISESNEIFGEDRLIELLRTCSHKGAAEVMTELRGAYHTFVGSGTQFDDMTAVVIKIPHAA